MTHASQEFALEPVGPFYFLVPQGKLLIRRGKLGGSPLQALIQHTNLLFGAPALADVAEHTHYMPLFRSARQRTQIDIDRELRTVLADCIQIQTGAHRPTHGMGGIMSAMCHVSPA